MATAQQQQTLQEQKTNEESLRQTQLIVENSYDAIIGETMEGLIVSWNGGASKMYGYSADEVIGRPFSMMVPDERKAEIPFLLDMIKAKEIIADYDTVRTRKDGVKIKVSLSASPITSDEGLITGISIVERDITKRKEAEESLHQIELIVDNSHDAITGSTLDGLVTGWNRGATEMLQYTRQEIIGKPMLVLFPDEYKYALPKLLEKVKKGEVIAEYSSVWLRKDGSRIDIEFSIAPLKNEKAEIVGASLVGRDITVRKKNEKHIKDLNEVRTKFIEIISHQLRTPLTSINWNLETMLNGTYGEMEETQHKFLRATYAASIDITRRIHTLLAAIDVEEGRVRYTNEQVAMDSLCAGVVNELRNKADLKKLSLTYTPPQTELPAIYGDGQQLRLAVYVLVENAIAYTKEGGKITATLAANNDKVRFTITDTGIGIPQTEQHLISSRFFRASNASTMQPDAFGLGLYVSRHTIEQHKGKTGFESKEGTGSTFWFEIPFNTETDASEANTVQNS